MAFAHHEFFPGIFHIQDGMGVCMTLLCGKERALLVDTGYGLEDVSAYVKALTALPVDVMLTHGHHDHALGAQWFDRVWMLEKEFPVYFEYTKPDWRRHVLNGAREKGIQADEEAYLNASMPIPEKLTPGEIDLGSLTVRVIACPGHTPGSEVVYVPKYGLLLTGDDWNPCTWLFFPEALCAQDYRKNMRELLRLPFGNVLCSHQFQLFHRTQIDQFMEYLTDDCLARARQVDTGAHMGINTAEAQLPMHQVLVFDRDRFDRRASERTKEDE